MNVLVTDGENRSALAVTRSLGRKGHSIAVVSSAEKNLAGASKFCTKSFLVTDPITSGNMFIRDISELVTKEAIDVILPVTEQSVFWLNKLRNSLSSKIVLACAPFEKMDAVSNKFKLFQRAKALGIAIPRTIFVSCAPQIQEIDWREIPFPVVIKPAFSKLYCGGTLAPTKVKYAHTQEAVYEIYQSDPVLQHPSLVQEMICGEGTGLFTLFDHHRHLALFSHRRILEKPPSGGVSVLSESVSLDEEMVAAAEKLLAEVDWEGVAMVEFKRDQRDGRAKLIEINGRFWGSLQLAVASGVDFPALCLEFYLDRLLPRPTITSYQIGRRLKWSLGLLDHLLLRLKSRDASLNLPPDTPTRWQVLMELLPLLSPDVTSDVYDPEDRTPFFVEIQNYLKNSIGY